MSDKLRAAALAALEMLSEDDRNADKCIRILEAALAEPEQEPIAWYHDDFGVLELNRHERVGWSPLYPAPPRREWVGLTDDEVNLIYAEPQTHVGQYARAIEAKLKEKNGG